ncbi:hypothetical protein Leryth_004733 [Lithospermum erythrorhizon]|nr:hypothetical protein Leryth_004733 [Lithospermum erythrorhizon]
MSTSSPFCLGTISPRKPAIVPSFSPTNNNEVQLSQPSEALSINPLNISSLPATCSTLVNRREAIGFGLGLCFLLMPQWCNVAHATETAPCQFTLTQSGLAYCDKAIGYGSQPSKGQLIKAHYVGKLENGTVFDSSYNRGKPLTFRIGVGEVCYQTDEN